MALNSTIAADFQSVMDMVEMQFDFLGISNPLMEAGMIFIIFVVLAYLVKFLFIRFLNAAVKKTETDVDDKIIEAVQNPILYLVLIIGFFVSTSTLGFVNYFGKVYVRGFVTLFSFVLFHLIYKVLKIIIRGLKDTVDKSKIKAFDDKFFPLLENIFKLVLALLFLFVLFGLWDINLAPLLASAGIAGIALAFAAQNTIANIFGGVSIFLDKPYEIGDYIVVKDKDRGEVIDIGLRSTKIRTRDNVLVSVPNSIMASTKLFNESGIQPQLRVRLDVDVAYGADIEKAEKVLLRVAKKADYVLKKPEPVVRYRAYKDFSIGLQLLFWIADPRYKGKYVHFMIKDIYKAFNKEKIEFPYPTQDIIFRNDLKLKK